MLSVACSHYVTLRNNEVLMMGRMFGPRARSSAAVRPFPSSSSALTFATHVPLVRAPAWTLPLEIYDHRDGSGPFLCKVGNGIGVSSIRVLARVVVRPCGHESSTLGMLLRFS